jgi:hypothetical protein
MPWTFISACKLLAPAKIPDKKRGHDVSCPYGPIGRWSGGTLTVEGEGAPTPVFLQLHILKDFKGVYVFDKVNGDVSK